jgi:hypothetical protein
VPPQLTDERLAWLAVRKDLRTMSVPHPALRILFALVRVRTGGRRLAWSGETNVADDMKDKKMRVYAVAVDELSRRLSKEERVVLRSSGTVPAWFMPEVVATAKTVRLG